MKNSVILLLVLGLFPVLLADTLRVPSEYPNIHSAISAAQDGDTVLVSPGHYNGGFSFQGKNIVLISSGSANNTFIESPFSDFHCVSITGGEDSTAVLEGFSITNMNFDGTSHEGRDPVEYGGGIYITNSSPTIRNNVIVNCWVVGCGGGVFILNSSSCLTENTITDNYAHETGGGIWAGGSSVSGQPLRIIDCTVEGNESNITGGMSITHSNAEIINNTIINNLGGTGQGAGGIGINSPSVLLYSNYISGNDGAWGGGVSISGGYTTVIGNLIVDNISGHAGGIYEYSNGEIFMENTTIAFNAAHPTEGLGGGLLTGKDTLNISNCIFWGNSASLGSQILIVNTHVSVDYSNVEFGEDSVYNFASSTLYWGSDNIDVDPQFETGYFGDYHLSYSSPCVDAGNPAWEYNDPEDPFNPGYALWPAMGTIRNDMGAFGGGAVNYWLTVEEEGSSSPETALLLKSFPNPFSTSCTVCYQLTEASQVNLSVFDLSGRLVETLVDEVVPAGMYSEYLDGSDLCSGMYLIRLVAGDLSTSRRCIVVR